MEPAHHTPSLDEVLTLLDQVADDADAVNHRIQALLADHRPGDMSSDSGATEFEH